MELDSPFLNQSSPLPEIPCWPKTGRLRFACLSAGSFWYSASVRRTLNIMSSQPSSVRVLWVSYVYFWVFGIRLQNSWRSHSFGLFNGQKIRLSNGVLVFCKNYVGVDMIWVIADNNMSYVVVKKHVFIFGLRKTLVFYKIFLILKKRK